MEKAKYYTSEYERELRREDLPNEDREVQLDAMRTWFFQNYEDPAERTPYESREGGYIWIWGGPYEAREELESEFSGVVTDELIEELSDELNGICWEWAPTEKPGDYDEYIVDDIAQITEFYDNFSSAILDIEKLLETKIDPPYQICFYRLLFVNVITALETYLSDAFINSVVPSKDLMRKFVESTPEFKSEKIPLAEVFKAFAEIELKAKSYLADVVWHNLGRVKPMYRDVLGIDFESDLGDLTRAIVKRHDIVHRNGKTKSGDEIQIAKQDVITLIGEVESFVQEVDQIISQARANNAIQPTADASANF